MCTREDTLTHNLGVLYIDDAMSYNSLTTVGFYKINETNTGLQRRLFIECFSLDSTDLQKYSHLQIAPFILLRFINPMLIVSKLL